MLAIRFELVVSPFAFFSSNSALTPASLNAALNPSLALSSAGCDTICVIPILYFLEPVPAFPLLLLSLPEFPQLKTISIKALTKISNFFINFSSLSYYPTIFFTIFEHLTKNFTLILILFILLHS